MLHRSLVLLLCVLATTCAERPGDTLPERARQAERALRDSKFEVALTLARGGRAAAAGAPDAEWWRARFGVLEADALVQSRQTDAARAALAALTALGGVGEAGQTSERAALAARRDYLDAQLAARDLQARGRLADALPLLERVREGAGRAGARATAFDSDLLRAAIMALTGDIAGAERLLHEVRAGARAEGDAFHEAAALNNLGMSRFQVNRYDEALEYLEPIVALDDLAGTGLFAGALNNAGISYARLGDFARAIALQERAIAADVSFVYQSRALGELGNTYVLAGNPEKAVPYLERALAAAVRGELERDQAFWTGDLAVASIVLGRWDEAARYNTEATRLNTRLAPSALPFNRLNDARIAAGRSRRDEARAEFAAVLATPDLAPSVAWEAHAGLARLLFAEGARDAAIREFDRALAIIERTRADLLKTEQQFFFPSRLRHFYDDYVDALVDAGLDQAALEVADAARAQVLASRQNGPAGLRRTTGAFTSMAAKARTTFVSYWLGRSRAQAWVVTGNGARRVALATPTEEIARLARRFRAEVEQSLANPLASPASSGDALAAAVLAPILPYLDAAQPVIVVADGALHEVNLEMLPVGTPRRYWIEQATVEMAPSLGLLVATALKATLRGALLIGDPTPPPGLPPLAHAGAELDAVAVALAGRPTTMARQAEATPASYRASQPSGYGIIHFAAHATVSAASPLDSAIELSPADGGYKLYARDVAAVPLSADLVTISACRSAAARSFSSEGLVGFAWAFMRAGARRVVAGLWDVDDRSTARLMAAFYQRLAAGDRPAVALRAAKLAMIAQGGNFAKPYYWAPFQVFTAAR